MIKKLFLLPLVLSFFSPTLAYDHTLNYTRDNRISKKALQNVRDFLLENGMISKEKTPTVEELYTEQFTGK